MKQQIFTRKSVNQYADFLLEIANSEEIEDDFITEMLAEKMSRLEAINTFKESVMIYYTYIRFCLIQEDYECADKFKSIVKIEYTNTIALLNAIGETLDHIYSFESDKDNFNENLEHIKYSYLKNPIEIQTEEDKQYCWGKFENYANEYFKIINVNEPKNSFSLY